MILQPFTLHIHLPTPLAGYRKDVIFKIKLPDYFSCRQNSHMISTALMSLLNEVVQKSLLLTIIPDLLFGQAMV